jgi:hypothetical protein
MGLDKTQREPESLSQRYEIRVGVIELFQLVCETSGVKTRAPRVHNSILTGENL